MKCPRCGNVYDTAIGDCPYCLSLTPKAGLKLGQDFISRLFAGDIPKGTPFGKRYSIEGLLGRGGMGIVYKANDSVLNEKVAIKLLNPLFSTDKDIIERFKLEIKLARKINHRNVIRIYDMGTVDGIRYISMEYVEGNDLKDVIRAEGGALPLNFGIMIIKQIVAGLQVAHDLGIIHRDIKPQNILIKKNGELKILDYGIARLSGSEDMTRTGSLMGSPVYMSPEQASGKDTDARSDIYSTGVIMYEIFTGRIPFLADTPIATALKHVNEEPPFPTSINPDLPVWVENVILKAMEKDPNDRFQRAMDIIDPIKGLHADRIVDTDIVICSNCGKRNHITNTVCSKCHLSLLKKQPIDNNDLLQEKDLHKEEDRLFQAATEAYKEGKLQISKDRLERILIINEKNTQAYQLLQKISSKISNEKRINLYHQNALISFQDRKFDDAISLWEKILKLDPKRKEAKDFLLKAKEAQGVYDRVKGFINKGLQAYNQNDYKQAIIQWEQAITIDPRNVEAAFYISKAQVLLNFERRTHKLYQLAEEYLSEKKYDQAIDYYQQLLKLDRENLSLSLKIDELEDIKKIDQSIQVGLQYFQKHDYESALGEWNRILSLDPDNEDAKNYIIQARAKINEAIRVKEIFRIGLLHYRDKRWKQAISRFEDVRKFYGPYQKDAEKYIKLAREEVEKHEKIIHLLNDGLKIYEQEHKDASRKIWGASAAIKQWEKILKFAPDHKEAKEYIQKAKLIIQRYKIMESSQKLKQQIPSHDKENHSDDHTTSLKLKSSKAKPSFSDSIEKTAHVRLYPELKEYIAGALFGGAVGDALGVGTTWRAMTEEETFDVDDYVNNTVGRFANVKPGDMSGEVDLAFKTASSIIDSDFLHPKQILKTMIRCSKETHTPLELSSEELLSKLRKGIPWKKAVSDEQDDFAPLYRAFIVAILNFNDMDKMFQRVKTVTLLTHKNQSVLSSCLAGAAAMSQIIQHKNRIIKSQKQLIGGKKHAPLVWDNNTFLKTICSYISEYDDELADKIMELIIYASMPPERFFDTVGIGNNAVETLLSSFYCFIRYPDNFSKAVTMAINAHGIAKHITGNRHGIGALTGFMCGAFNGFVEIPSSWINGLTEHVKVFDISQQLYNTHYYIEHHES